MTTFSVEWVLAHIRTVWCSGDRGRNATPSLFQRLLQVDIFHLIHTQLQLYRDDTGWTAKNPIDHGVLRFLQTYLPRKHLRLGLLILHRINLPRALRWIPLAHQRI